MLSGVYFQLAVFRWCAFGCSVCVILFDLYCYVLGLMLLVWRLRVVGLFVCDGG